jgi:DNA polymerase-1
VIVEKLILIDGNSIANRAFYALPLLSNSGGLHTNAVYGFTTMLLRLIEEEKPTHFLVAFDAGKITFRHKEYKEYKGGRSKTPPELSEQFPLIKQLLEAFSISQFELEGYEADDIIGTLTRMGEEKKMEVLVVSGDKDMLQLASEHVTIALTKKGISEVERFDPAYIHEVYGLKPDQIIDLKGLMGDSSDNIPGIPGIGEKTGLKLLHEYGTIEEVLSHVSDLKGKMKEKVEAHADDARMSKDLATIFREVPIEQTWDHMAFVDFDQQAVMNIFRKLEFKSLIEKMNLSEGAEGKTSSEETVEWTVINKENVSDFVKKLPDIKAVHVEVVGENPHQAKIVGISFYNDEQCYYMPFDALREAGNEQILEWFADEKQEKWIYDTHKAEVALAWEGIILKGVTFDVLLAAYLLSPTESNYSLNGLAQKYELPHISSDDEVFGKGAKFHIPELAVVSEHLSRKALAIHRLSPMLKKELKNTEMDSLFDELELPLAVVLAAMEIKGISVDVEGLKQYGKELDGEVRRLIKEIHEMAGSEFNINSPKQLGEILFDKLGLPVIKKTKTGYSTDAEVLEKLEPYHEIVANLLHYRTLAKLQSTYVEGLLKEVREDGHKVHTYFRQTIAATGRLSSQFPNLQNIPIRLEEGRKIRKVFVPSNPGWSILAADYSQIELRVLAHISRDENLKEAFLNDMDIHTKTAMDVFGVEADAVDSNMRRQAKAVNFGIVYGISDYGLSQNLNITRKEASRFIDQYFAVFKGVRKFMDDVVKQAREDGFVSTMLYRRRYLPDIKASNFNLRSFAERTAMNTPIQGTAADIIKLAMVQIAERMDQENLKSRMLLQVHDELVFEVPEDEMDRMRKLVPEVMESALSLDVPLKVDVSFGQNWYEAK